MLLDPRELKRRVLLRFKGVEVESGKALIGPTTVQIHLTNLCNLTCRYCYYYGVGTTHRPDGKTHLPFDTFAKIIRNCVDLQVDEVLLSGQGEPSLHPHFYEMLEYLEDQPLFVQLYSNATFPLKRCSNILKSVDRITINLGAPDRATYLKLQGKDLFIRVIKNIRELARLKPQLNPNFDLKVVFIANSVNTESQSKTENLVKKLGADVIYPKPAETYDFNDYVKFPGHENKTKLEGEWPPCYHGWFYSAIKLNGNVNVCCTMQRITIGNVFKTSFKDIWQSEGYRAVRPAALKGETFRNYDECINCCMALHNKRIGEQMKIYDQSKKRYDDKRTVTANP